MSARLVAGGAAIAASTLTLAASQPAMGSPMFVGCVAVATAGYLLAMSGLARDAAVPPVALLVAVLAGAAWKAPLVVASDAYATDTIRYIWDARVQRAGLSPYLTRPDDPAAAEIHSPLTRHVDAPWLPTIYPPLAQWYFRAVTAFHESARAFRVAAVAVDLAIAAVLWSLLRRGGYPSGWLLAYAWHPLVPLEGVLGGHLDLPGVLALTLAWAALVHRRPAVAAVGFACAVLIKPLALVLAPLFWGRVGPRHVALATAVAATAAFALPGGTWPVGSLPAFVDGFRFNGPLFAWLSPLLGPRAVAGLAVVTGLALATVFRWRHAETAPEAWLWPMTAALLLAPVIYPWYLLWLLPFPVLGGPGTWPVWAWTLSVGAVYPTWYLAAAGARWAVPAPLMLLEFAAPLLVAIIWLALTRTGPLSQGPRRPVNRRASASAHPD